MIDSVIEPLRCQWFEYRSAGGRPSTFRPNPFFFHWPSFYASMRATNKSITRIDTTVTCQKKDEKQWSKNETCAQKKRKKNSVISGTTSCGTRLFVDGCSLMMDQTSLNICCPFCSLSNRSCANFFATRLIVCNSSAKRVRISIRYGGSTDIF